MGTEKKLSENHFLYIFSAALFNNNNNNSILWRYVKFSVENVSNVQAWKTCDYNYYF